MSTHEQGLSSLYRKATGRQANWSFPSTQLGVGFQFVRTPNMGGFLFFLVSLQKGTKGRPIWLGEAILEIDSFKKYDTINLTLTYAMFINRGSPPKWGERKPGESALLLGSRESQFGITLEICSEPCPKPAVTI